MGVETNPFPITLVLATDGSENTAQATRAALDIANRRGSKIHLVHVWHDVPTSFAHSFVKGELRRQGREILDEEVRRIQEEGGTVTRSHLREGGTFEEAIQLSEEISADLLIVGSRGHGGLRRILMGSNSEDIVHHASGEAVEAKPEDRAGELEDLLQQRPETRGDAGDPAEALLEAAREGESPTLVAVGSRGLGPVGRLRLGSVSTRVIRAGSGAVLVYPPAGER